jgi:gliding motility-associated-like protein
LSGHVIAAGGGWWTGGTGTFAPNDTTLNAQYTPSPAEVTAGFVNLTLITTHNYTCPPDTDVVRIDIDPYPTPVISGPNPVCQFSTGTYSTPAVFGDTYNWVVTGGTLTSGQGTNAINVQWGGPGAGTVTVTQTNPTGCDSTVTFNVTVNPKPNPVIVGPTDLCQYDVAPYSILPILGSTYVWAVTGGTVASGQGTEAVSVQWGPAGPGSVTVTQTNSFGCDTTVTVAVNIDPKPVPVLVGPAQPCAWTTAAYSVANVLGNTYSWVVSGGNIASGQGTSAITVDWLAAGPASVTLTQANPLGCDTTVTMAVTVNPRPIAAITGPLAVCEFDPAVAYSSPLNTGASYAWTVAGGTIVSGQGTPAIGVDWSTSGAGSVSLLVTLLTGCDTAVSVAVVINPNPDPLVTGATNVCAFTSEPYSTPLVLGHTYSWTASGGAVTAGQGTNAVTVLWGAAGAGSVTVTQTAPTGCDSTTTLAVTVNPTPQPLIAGPAAACEFTGGHSYSTPPVPGHSYAWTVTGGNITAGQGTSGITVFWLAAGPGTVTLTQTAAASAASCDTTVTLNVTVNPKPNPVIVGPTTICALALGASYQVGQVLGDNYLWTVTGGNIATGQGTNAITVNWGTPGVGTVSVQQSNPLGCDTTVLINVTLLPQPTPTITGPTPICATATNAVYTTPFVGGNSYTWTVVGGSIASGQGSNAIIVNWNGVPGTGIITLTESHPLGCDSTLIFNVNLLPAPIPVITGDSIVCAHTAITYLSNLDPSATITWTVTGGGTIVSGQGTNELTVVWPGPGTGTVSVHYIYTNGCEATDMLPINILSAPIPIILGQDTICQYSTNTFSTPLVQGVSYTWTPVGGTVLTGQGTNSVVVQWGVFGNYQLILEAVAGTGCDTTISVPVTVLEGPDANINPLDMIICKPGEVTFNGVVSLGEVAYHWTLGNGGTSNEGVVTSGYWIPGHYNIQLIVDGPYACRDTTNAHLLVLPGPHAEFSVIPGLLIEGDNDTIQFINHSTQYVFYSWDFGDGTTDTAFSPLHVYPEPGFYTVTLTVVDSLGCTDVYSLTLHVVYELGLYVPNAFTPNGDGLNDAFNVGHWNVLEFHIQIFSRWGEMIFESWDKNFQWSGHYHDEPTQEGVYVWKIDAVVLGGTKVYRAGSVTLIR